MTLQKRSDDLQLRICKQAQEVPTMGCKDKRGHAVTLPPFQSSRICRADQRNPQIVVACCNTGLGVLVLKLKTSLLVNGTNSVTDSIH
jgi:hypothetical protein